MTKPMIPKKNPEVIFKFLKSPVISSRKPIDLMKLIDQEDIYLLNSDRIRSMSRIDWGRTMAIPNQYIQRNILRYKLQKFGFCVYATDECNINKFNNSPGYDLIVISPKNKIFRIQCKLRQVNGLYDYSVGVHFETTRRHSEQNKNRNESGHITYSTNEFDFVFVSLVNDRQNRISIGNCNRWSWVLVPVQELIDERRSCCSSKISSKLLKKYLIDLNENLSLRFN